MKIKNMRMPVMAALSVAVVLGLVGCAGAYPVGPNGANPNGANPDGTNPLGYPSQDAAQGASGAGSSYSAPGNEPGQSSVPGSLPGQTSPGSGVVNSLTPGAPYPMPNPSVPIAGSPYPMPNPSMPIGIPLPLPQPNMPPGIIGFFPPVGLQVCPTPHVAVTVQLSDALRIAGAVDLSKVSLTLDGKDILSQIQLIAPMIYPQSQVTLLFQPKTPLALGPHQVKLTYVSATGAPLTLTWDFTVANIACQ